MAKKGKKNRIDVVYSTDPDFEYSFESDAEVDTPAASVQKLRIQLDRKKRKGKEVTLVTGFVGREEDCQELGKGIKKACGVGGSVKDGEILIQGDQREKVLQLLLEKGYQQTKISGGK